MTEIVVLVSVLVLIAAAAPRYGVDSRSAYAGRRVRPVDDVRALGRWVARRWGGGGTRCGGERRHLG